MTPVTRVGGTRVHVGDDCQYFDRAPWSLHLDCAGGELYIVTRGRSLMIVWHAACATVQHRD